MAVLCQVNPACKPHIRLNGLKMDAQLEPKRSELFCCCTIDLFGPWPTSSIQHWYSYNQGDSCLGKGNVSSHARDAHAVRGHRLMVCVTRHPPILRWLLVAFFQSKTWTMLEDAPLDASNSGEKPSHLPNRFGWFTSFKTTSIAKKKGIPKLQKTCWKGNRLPKKDKVSRIRKAKEILRNRRHSRFFWGILRNPRVLSILVVVWFWVTHWLWLEFVFSVFFFLRIQSLQNLVFVNSKK